MIELGGVFSLADMLPSVKLLEMLSGMTSETKRMHEKADKIFGNIINDHRAFKAMGEAHALVNVLLDIEEHVDVQCPLTTDNIKAVLMMSLLFDIIICCAQKAQSSASNNYKKNKKHKI